MSFKIHTEGTNKLTVERKERRNLREQKLGGPVRPRATHEWRNQEFLEFLDNGNEGSSNGALVMCKTLF